MGSKTIASKSRKAHRPRGYKSGREVSNCRFNGRQLSPRKCLLSSWSHSPEESFFTPLPCGTLDSPEVHQHVPLESYSHSSPLDPQHSFTMGTQACSYIADNVYMASNDWTSLSPLSSNQDRLSSFAFWDASYAPSGLSPLHESKENTTNASPGGYDPPWDMCWTSPDSEESELDNDSILSSSTPHLSPESSESELRHSPMELEDEADEDDLYRPYPSTSPEIYPLEETTYPPHFYSQDPDAPLPSSPPPSQVSSSSWLLPPSPREQDLPPPIFHDYTFSLHDPPTNIPSSPSRRTSRELPEDDEDSFGLQLIGAALPSSSYAAPSDSRQPVPLRSFPGAETDDDLIPAELASKNYIPDPSFVVHATSPINNAGLLLWDPPSAAKIRDANDLPPTRSPPPEDFTLDLHAFAELEGQELEEMKRINELRGKTGNTQGWERERNRELSALLRLKTEKLGNATDNESARSSRAGDDKVEHERAVPPGQEQYLTSTEEAPCIGSSDPPNGSTPSVISKDSNDATPPTPVKPPPPKSKITNMAQLVASMVFHRQQDALRRSPTRPRTWSGSSYGNAMQTTSKTHPTPRSPLRQVSLPCDLESIDLEDKDGGDAENAELSELFESPLPLSPLVLADSPLGWGGKWPSSGFGVSQAS